MAAVGRPLKPAIPGEKSALGLRVAPEIKSRLDAAARVAGRTQSQEAELRIETSFRAQDQFDQALALLAGGETQLAPVLRAIAITMGSAGTVAAALSHAPARERTRAGHWFDDAFAASKAIEAARCVLDALAPEPAAVEAASPDQAMRAWATAERGKPARPDDMSPLLWAIAIRTIVPNAVSAGLQTARESLDTTKLGSRVQHYIDQMREHADAADETDAAVTKPGAEEKA